MSVINFSHSCVSLSVSLQTRPSPFQRHRPELFSHCEMTTKLPEKLKRLPNAKEVKGTFSSTFYHCNSVIPYRLPAFSSLPYCSEKPNLLTCQTKISGCGKKKKKKRERPVWERKLITLCQLQAKHFKRSHQMLKEENSMPQANGCVERQI